ncbi:MAG TPA: DUF5615 family PIN-like protein [Opitutales bacterium]|nr:DUF5615 family PIN-like protein [Opitutales bacterium]
MKLLFDQNLSHELVRRLADVCPASAHVRQAGLAQATDQQVWDYAKTQGFVLVSQDADFAELSRLRGSPPKLIWLRCGNTATTEVEKLLRRHAGLLNELGQNPRLDFIEIY